jgi:hypothetical protein
MAPPSAREPAMNGDIARAADRIGEEALPGDEVGAQRRDMWP